MLDRQFEHRRMTAETRHRLAPLDLARTESVRSAADGDDRLGLDRPPTAPELPAEHLPLQSARAWHSALRPSGGASGRRTPVARLLPGLSQERLCRFRSQERW